MSYELKYYTDVTEGKFQKNVRDLIAEHLPYFNGKRVEITIKRIKATRSLKQNNYLHALFTIFKNELNALGNEFTMQEVKDMCKMKFALKDLVNEDTGEIYGQAIKNTSKMSKGELNEFVENIIRWAASSFNIILPYPNENMEIKFE